MQIAPVAEMEMYFGTYLKQCQDGPVIVIEDGRPVAVLISVP
jgi:antitoxin (DNA-binding transcriptional repressor) of toxin-antitoxin stability system